MPKKLAAKQDVHAFWYKQIVAPPKDYAKWDDLIHHFARHLIERYGIGEVSQWYFEVWNEPNIDFWTGDPKQETYFELYDHTARALKSVNAQLRVGGPSTAAADWVDVFLDHVVKQNIPIDFVSSHGYADDTVENLFHTHEDIPMDQRVCHAIKKVHDQITASGRPKLPLMWTEWNVPSFGPLNARDTVYVGPALADDIRQCDGSVEMMSYWTFDDVFEENGVVEGPFHGGFGLIAAEGIKKPPTTDSRCSINSGRQDSPIRPQMYWSHEDQMALSLSPCGILLIRTRREVPSLLLWNFRERRLIAVFD